MKFKLFTFLIVFLLSIGMVSAGLMPYAVSGYVKSNGVELSNVQVTISNLNEGVTLVTPTDNNGFFIGTISDWGDGDSLQVDVCDYNVNPQCRQTKVIADTCPNGGGCDYSFVIGSNQVKECPDGSIILLGATCPVVDEPEPPEPEIIYVEDEDCTRVSDEKYSCERKLTSSLSIELSDLDLKSVLLDTIIDFDDDDINVHEGLAVDLSFFTGVDDDDFEDSPYVGGEKELMVYTYYFDDEVDIGDVKNSEPLEIVLLGRAIKIVDIDADSLIIESGTEKPLSPGEKVGGVTLVNVGEKSCRVRVGDVEETISERSTEKVNGIEILCDEVFYEDTKTERRATLLVGDDIRQTITMGSSMELFGEDDDESDAEWLWDFSIVSDELKSISAVYNQKRLKTGDDEDFKVLGINDELALPNNYIVFRVDSLSSSDDLKYTFEVTDDGLKVTADSDEAFVVDSKDYDKIYVSQYGIYDSDDELLGSSAKLFTSDFSLEWEDSNTLSIGNVKLKLDLSDILVNDESLCGDSENFLTHQGFMFSDPQELCDEDDADDREFVITIPEETPKLTLLFLKGTIPEYTGDATDDTPVDTPDDKVDDKVDTPDTSVEPPIDTNKPLVDKPIEPPVVDDKPEPPVVDEEPNDIWKYIIGVIAAILAAFGWSAGFKGLANYYWNKGEELIKAGDKEEGIKFQKRAIKMAQTAIRKALAGEYKKKQG